jgi:hypothetical protein
LQHLTNVQPWKVRRSLITGTLAIVIAGVAALLLLCAVVFRHHQQPATTITSTPPATRAAHRLGLNVEREGQVLLVAWDRSSQPVHNATHAILHIKDGPQQSQLDLNNQQLGAANVKYWPETQKVTFMLEVYQREGSISESVQVVGGAGEPAPVTAAQPKRFPNAPNGAQGDASVEPARPSPFAVRARREIRPEPVTPAPDPQHRLMVTAATTPPPSAAEKPDQESRLARMVSKIPLLRRLKKHPQHSENEYPLR